MRDPHSWRPSPPRYETEPARPSGWSEWSIPSPYEMLLTIQRHLGNVEGQLESEARETRRHLNAQDEALREIKDRVSALERRPMVHLVDPPSQSPARVVRWMTECRAFLGSVATPREWAIGGVLVALTLAGIVDPQTIRRWLFVAIGMPPI